ncbi:MAG TPA: protein kinase [Vicinamibacterales bacterium]|nr:protein kinase [Vicinamibacterales bacterium]
MPSTYSRPDFRGTSRFELRRHLGTGGMGAVYQAYDRDRKEDVALKTLIRADPTALYLFKREFRNLADVVHPNLVSLYELLFEDGHWFFTMELLDGVDFLTYVQSGVTPPERRRIASLGEMQTTAVELSGPAEAYRPTYAPAVSPPQIQRLRVALGQIAEGLGALHDKGYMHRDLKPSNVLATVGHRVVILDFGLSGPLSHPAETDDEPLIGTPTYMAPEQAERARPGPAGDWYAVGIMLYEALTGRPPFVGSHADVLHAKRASEAPPASELVEGVPRDLDFLCTSLLRRDPAARPTAQDVFRLLQLKPAGGATPTPVPARHDSALVGRERERRELAQAFRVACTGRAVTIGVFGSSGVGKTALVGAFVADLQRRTPQTLVLSGRCYEREFVPYKAVDGIVDRLAHHLLSLPSWQVSSLLPPGIRALAVIFPVLLRVETIASAADVAIETGDPLGLRRTAFGALRELLARIGRPQPLVLTIDDLQWTDADSLALLEELLRPPHAPPLLLLLTFRSEEIEARPFLQPFAAYRGDDRRGLEVRPLTEPESEALASRLLHEGGHEPEVAAVSAIAAEAGGNPFLIEQLAGCYRSSEARRTSRITVAEMLEMRLAALPAAARDVLDVLAVAGRPTDPEVAGSAAGVEGTTRSLAAALRSAQMIRSTGSSDKIEIYHDRIREALVARLADPATRHIHRSLAAAIVRSGHDDPEALCEHYLGAGEREAAGTAALAAARRASAALAFDRAASFYRRALELPALTPLEKAERRRLLGGALANAGRTLEAARAYLEAAGAFDPTTAHELRRRAAEQLLMGGHVDGGVDVMRTVLEAVGLKLPGGPRRALAQLLVRRAQIRARGLDFVERRPEEVPAEELRRIDACWAASIGLGLVDLVAGAYFQSTQLLLALRAGEPYRVARALAVEAASVSSTGGRAQQRAGEILRLAEAPAKRVGVPHALGLCALCGGMVAFLGGHWKRCVKLSDEAAGVFRDRCTGATWEYINAVNFALGGLLYLGELAEIARRLSVVLPDARERGNLYSVTEVQTRYNVNWLAAGDPETARAEVSQAIERWSHRGFHRQHYNALLASVQIELYLGRGEDAQQLVEGKWRELSHSLLMRVQVLRIEARFLRARARLSVAAGDDGRRQLALAAADARAIAAERTFWSEPLAGLVHGLVEAVQGRTDHAVARLTTAVDGFDRAGMGLHSRAAAWALGTVLGGDEGQRLIAESRLWMQTQGIKDPPSFTAMMAPGLGIGAMP